MEFIERNDRVRDGVLRRLKSIDSGKYVRDLDFEQSTDSLERRRVTEYTNGITRWRRWLDFLIDHWARAGSKIHPTVRNILRIGAYELVILERPDHAIVNASVEQAKRAMRGRGSASFVNAILRQIGRNMGDLPVPNTGNRAADLAIRHSHPSWMASRWIERFGEDETRRLLIWNNSRPHFGLRVNPLATTLEEVERRLTELGVSWQRGKYARDFIQVESLQPILDSELVTEGGAAIQDESAGLVVDLLDPLPGDFFVDACAAPGGKLLRAAIQMKGEGEIVAIDPNKERLKMAADFARRHGLSTIEFSEGSFLDWEAPGDRAPDKILLDVPCSGLGVLARRPDSRWRKQLSDIHQLTQLQDRLLDRAAEILRPGGILTYATCTIEPEENEVRIRDFLSRRPDFEIAAVGELIPAELVTGEGFMVTLPQRHSVDGAFAARLRKGN